MKIIALAGKKLSGKTTICNYLKTSYPNENFITINFKDAMISEMRANLGETLTEIASVYGMTVDELFDKKPPVMRRLMQNYGTQIRRGDDDSYWVKKWRQSVLRSEDDCIILVDDVRFFNEAMAVELLGGKVFTLRRYTDSSKEKLHADDGDSHVSEKELEFFDFEELQYWDYETAYSEVDRVIMPYLKIICTK